MKPNKSQVARKTSLSGQAFENEIEHTNTYYQRKGIATVTKIPTQTRVTGMENGKAKWEVSGKTGCDYVGVYRGKGIAFEAKSTSNKTNFPITARKVDVVKPHQIRFLKDFQGAGGEAFILIRFKVLDRTFKLSVQGYQDLLERAKKEGKKSFSLSWIEELSMEVERKGYTLDYLNEKRITTR